MNARGKSSELRGTKGDCRRAEEYNREKLSSGAGAPCCNKRSAPGTASARDLDLQLRDFQISTDLSREKVVHLAMPRDCRRLPGDWIQENGMAATFA